MIPPSSRTSVYTFLMEVTPVGEIGRVVPKQSCKFLAKESLYENSNTKLVLYG